MLPEVPPGFLLLMSE